MFGKVVRNVALGGVLAGLIVGCGSDGSDGAAGDDGRRAVIAMFPEVPGANCTNGGTRIDSGLDENGNGLLDSAEVVGSQYVCNGAGSSVAQSLVLILDEPAGANCANGGEKFVAGQDTNANGVLDSTEINSTGYACDGGNAVGGNRILLALVSEPGGTNCPSGGVRVTSGPDSNGNNALDGGEIVSTNFVCDGANGGVGAPGQSALIATTAEPAGANCNYGGTRISAGVDTNGNGTLDTSEATAASYACNGAPGPGITWVQVPGDAIVTTANTGYLVTKDVAQAVLLLPSAPAVGDVVHVAGHGRGGWKIAQNAGQHVVTSGLPGGAFGGRLIRREQSRPWWPIACSADCEVVVAAADGGQIHKSIDGGASWQAQESNRAWRALAASASGHFLFAAAAGDHIYKGYDWVDLSYWDTRGPVASWTGIASSADGSRVVAVAGGGQIYTSTDEGDTWTPRETNRNWISVASSADGVKLVAAVRGGQLYTSVDAGLNWTPRATNRDWWGVASSADGVKLVAADTGVVGGTEGRVFTSSDSGATWTERLFGSSDWSAVASSSDGTRIAIAPLTGVPMQSLDSGVTWHSLTLGGAFAAIASSADGTKVVAGSAFGGSIAFYSAVSVAATTTGTSGAIIGGQHEAIALQYAGGGRFVVLSHAGTFGVQ